MQIKKIRKIITPILRSANIAMPNAKKAIAIAGRNIIRVKKLIIKKRIIIISGNAKFALKRIANRRSI